MQGTKICVDIDRNTNQIGEDNEYIQMHLYKGLLCTMIERKQSDSGVENSQADEQESFALIFSPSVTNIKVGDTVSYSDAFGEVILKVYTRPKFIEFESGEKFIKVIAKIGV